MPSIRLATALGIGATNTNILAGSKFEFMPVNSAVLVYAVTGAASTEITMDVSFGNVIEGDGLAVPVEPGTGTGPNTDEHLIASGVAAAGDRIVIKLASTSAGAEEVRTLVKINPL